MQLSNSHINGHHRLFYAGTAPPTIKEDNSRSSADRIGPLREYSMDPSLEYVIVNDPATKMSDAQELANQILSTADAMDPKLGCVSIATISSGFEKGDFLVREEKGQRV